jgi:hypothetical protein
VIKPTSNKATIGVVGVGGDGAGVFAWCEDDDEDDTGRDSELFDTGVVAVVDDDVVHADAESSACVCIVAH